MRWRLRISPAREARGFTLPEMLVVVAIVALTTLLVVPMFSRATDADALRAGARELSGTLREARRIAIQNRDNYAVVIDCNAIRNTTADPDLTTRFWIAHVDITFDPATDSTDVLHQGAPPPPFNGEFTTLEQIGDVQELPPNIIVVAAMIDSTGYQGNDFATGAFRLNATRTEDTNLDNAIAAGEDVGVDGFEQLPVQPSNAVDAGEDDGLENEIYRVIRFGPQGNADRATIWLWNVNDGGAPLPDGVLPNAPFALRAVGLPPGMTLTGVPTQQSYFTVSDQTQDAHYYTVQVNPTTGATEVFDYARGTATVGPPADWDLDKDGA